MPRTPANPSTLATLVVCLPLAFWLSACADETPPVGPPEVAPDFALPRLADASQVTLAGQLGKTVIIDFWATWCVPCEFQVPELNAFQDAHRDDSDVALFGISVDSDGPEVVAEWTAEKGVRYPILLSDDALAREFGVDGFPTIVVIDPKGEIDSRHVGLIQQSELEEILTRLRGEI